MDDLARIFIPGTPQFQARLGLTAYLPAVVPAKAESPVPDKIAIIVYESQSTYGDAFKTLGGRAYASLHGTVFEFADQNRKSTSAWPSPREVGEIEWFDKPQPVRTDMLSAGKGKEDMRGDVEFVDVEIDP